MLKNKKWFQKTPDVYDIGIFFEPLEPRLLLSGSMEAGIDSPSPDSFQNTQTDVTQESVAIGDIANDLSLIGSPGGDAYHWSRSRTVPLRESLASIASSPPVPKPAWLEH